jgi:hypothetical protein
MIPKCCYVKEKKAKKPQERKEELEASKEIWGSGTRRAPG